MLILVIFLRKPLVNNFNYNICNHCHLFIYVISNPTGALIYRLTGVSLDLEFPLISDICFQYPQMLDIIFNCLNSNYQNLSSTQSLIPILTLIVRFSPSFDHSLIV